MGKIQTLPKVYPDHWVIIRDSGALSFSLDDRQLVVDSLEA